MYIPQSRHWEIRFPRAGGVTQIRKLIPIFTFPALTLQSSTPQEAQGLERKRKSGIGEVQREDAFISDVSTPHNAYLDPRDTYHVFTARDGLPRLAGSTTGLPLLCVQVTTAG